MILSIIIVSYNTKDLLRKCVESVINCQLTNNQSPVTEIIVIDNASSDGSPEMVKKDFPGIKLIINQENVGFARAVNQGISLTNEGPVLLLNSDTLVKDNALELLLEAEHKLGPAIIGAKLINPDGTIQPSVFCLPTVLGAIKEYWFGKKNRFSKFSPELENLQQVEAVSGGAMLISRGTIEKIGLLDERFFFYFEDLDYCRKAKNAGIKVYFLPSARIIHEHGASGHSLAVPEDQWRRLIPSSKLYHGPLNHFLINLIIRLSQLWKKMLGA